MLTDAGQPSVASAIDRAQSANLAMSSRSFSSIVDQLGTDEFHRTLRAALYELTGFNSCLILSFSASAPPIVLEHCSTIQPDRFRHCYMTQAYRLDPFYTAAVQGMTIGVSRCKEIFDYDFASSAYHNTYYKDVPLVDEIGILCPVSALQTIHISLGRCTGAPHFDPSVLDNLNAAEPLLASLVRKHALLRPDLCPRAAPLPADKGEEFDAAWLRRVNATRREMEVALLVLRGHTNASIACVLGISEDTVKVHRKRLYVKLNISSQAELFMKYMNSRPSEEPGASIGTVHRSGRGH
ncbi:helix-turn-helix transcriptional regulator [Ancylobacter rudongensis]|uniref:Regulatory protein, luxR family n=1 Tax=Ancylobacter rudongensis TaxID=177413 RepID=A0A1G4SXJ0_9HYPH|nr:LuxR C-terminal-related transcriptional regulator [Ancylobacter rudongensis]SCW73863.1 regulatory protein, luxR family [Ancylobacter rudongensis]